jgi:hypothetical protein
MGWTIRRSNPGRGKNFSLLQPSRPSVVPTQPPIQRISEILTGLKRQQLKANHLSQTNADIKNQWSSSYTPPWRWQGQLYFSLAMLWNIISIRTKLLLLYGEINADERLQIHLTWWWRQQFAPRSVFVRAIQCHIPEECKILYHLCLKRKHPSVCIPFPLPHS